MKKRKKKKRKKSGIRLLALVLLALLCAAGLAAAEKPYAVIAGTVFREPGFVLPNAEVVLRMKAPAPGVKHLRTLASRTDAGGEFAFRVPAGKAEYAVSVKADGYFGEEKLAKIEFEERVDIYFTLRAVQ